MSFLKIFGEQVRDYRVKLGLTQEELAYRAGGWSTSTISHIENGILQGGPKLLPLKNLAKALGIPVCSLIGENEDNVAGISIEEDSFLDVEKQYDPYELSQNLTDSIHTIDGIELQNGEAKQILDFARFLILQREELSGEILIKVTEFIKQREA